MAKKKVAAPLTRMQELYLSQNLAMGDDALAQDTGLDVARVRPYRRDAQAAASRESPMDRLLHRETASGKKGSGVVAMTEEAATYLDDISQVGVITEEMITRAVAAKDFKLAADLQERRKSQTYDREQAEFAKNAGRWHSIR
jgi:hypothetical protein